MGRQPKSPCTAFPPKRKTALALMEYIEFSKYSQKPSKTDYKVIFMKKFMECQKANENVMYSQEKYWLWSENHWKIVDSIKIMQYLENRCIEAGMPAVMIWDVKFQKDLLEQFEFNAYRDTKKNELRVNLINGTVEINLDDEQDIEVLFREHRKDDFLTYVLPYNYDITAKCPKFKAFFNQVQPEEMFRNIILEFLGWVFIPTSMLKLEKTVILKGEGSNGKSVIFDIVRALFGKENMSYLSPKDLADERSNNMLGNSLLNYSSEFESSTLDNEQFKKVCSGEPLKVREIYGKPYNMYDYAKLMFNANNMKNIEHSYSFLRRFILIPFDVKINETEKDVNLAKKIVKEELSGIFNLVLEAMVRVWGNKAFSNINNVSKYASQYMTQNDNIAQFIEWFGQEKGLTYKINQHNAYEEYAGFCKRFGYRSVGLYNFQKRLERYEVNFYKEGHNVYLDCNTVKMDWITEEVKMLELD